MYRHIRHLALGALVVSGVFAGPLTSHHAPVQAKTITIGFADEDEVNAFTANVYKSMEASAKAAGYKFVGLNNNYNANTALSNAQILANDKVSLAVEFQVDAKIAPAIAATFAKAKIPTISIDIPQPNAVFFGVNNFGQGVLVGRALGTYAKQQGWAMNSITEVLLPLVAAGPIPQLRMDGIDAGIRQVLPNLPKSALLEQDGNGTIADSQRVMANLLPRIPTGNHILVSAINDESLTGALRAIQLAGRETNAYFAGHGADALGLGNIRTDAHWLGDAAYFPEFYGHYIIQVATKMLNGQKVTPYVLMPTLFLTKANIASYYPGKTTTAVKLPAGGVTYSMTPKAKG